MKNLIQHIHSKPTHHRRRISLQISACITAIVFIGWFATLGLRLSATPPSLAQNSTGFSLSSATAAVGNAFQDQLGQIKSQLHAVQSPSNTQTTPPVPAPQATSSIVLSAPATVLSGQPLD